MSFILSSALQQAVFETLKDDSALALLIGNAIYDAPPPDFGQGAGTYVSLGEETVKDGSSATSRGAIHELAIKVHSREDGFETSKAVAEQVCTTLEGTSLFMPAGNLVSLALVRAQSEKRAHPERRRITMKFRAFVEE
jgi:hypothetical protein